jgi:rubrerythrin
MKGIKKMKNKDTVWMCTNCGFSSAKRFEEDICPKCHLTFWKCTYCAYTLISETAPETCPECGVSFKFSNITCYIPEWEDNEHLDSQY